MKASRLAVTALVLSCGLSLAPAARAAIITNAGGTIQVGVGTTSGSAAALVAPNTALPPVPPQIGIRRVADNYDPIIGSGPGGTSFILPREYWGVAAGSVSGFVDPNGATLPHVQNIVLNGTPSFTANSGTVSTFLNAGSGNVLQIDQRFSFASANVLDIHVTITNLTNSPQAILYRRGVDWDIRPFSGALPSEIITVPPLSFPVVSATAQDIAPSADPLVPYGPLAAPPGGGTFGPADLGAGLTLSLGTLDPMNLINGRISTSFDVFEGINNSGESPAGLLADMNAAGANYVILGQSFNGVNSAALGVLVQVPVPEPATVALFGLGLAGLAGWRWRRQSPA